MCIKELEPRQKQSNYAAHLRRDTPAVNGSQTGPLVLKTTEWRTKGVMTFEQSRDPGDRRDYTWRPALRRAEKQILFQIIVNSYGSRDPGGPGIMPFSHFSLHLLLSFALVRQREGHRLTAGRRGGVGENWSSTAQGGNTLAAGSTLKVTPTFCYTFGSAPSSTPPGRRRGNCNQIQCSEDSLFSFHCRTDAKSRSLITYYGRWTVQFITDCKIKDASPKHADTFCILHQKSCNVSLWFHGAAILKSPSSAIYS